MTRRYWHENPDSMKNKHLLPQHEALHMAVAMMLGAKPKWILLRKTTGACDYTPNPLPVGWREAAIKLAPALIDDMSPGDAGPFSWIPARRRGFAWGWLKRNREEITQRANEIARHMGPRPGRLLPTETSPYWEWVPKKPKRRRNGTHD
jgi:hypothetical protein